MDNITGRKIDENDRIAELFVEEYSEKLSRSDLFNGVWEIQKTAGKEIGLELR